MQPFQRNTLIRNAIGEAIYVEMGKDSSIHLFGEGAQVKVHYDAPKIEAMFPDRVHTLPISEDGNVNFAIGTALRGVKPIIDIVAADFLYRAMDSICNTAAKLSSVQEGYHTIVIRAEFLTGGPTTGQRPEALFTHIPGLHVVIPSTPKDAYGLMLSALRQDGVTLFFEDRMIEDSLIDIQDRQPIGPIPLGYTKERCYGGINGRLTIVTYGVMRQLVEEILGSEAGVDLIDLRTLYPIGWDNILNSLRRTGALLVIEPDVQYGGIGAEIVATVVEKMPGVRVKRLGGRRSIIPASTALHCEMMPKKEQILDAIASF